MGSLLFLWFLFLGLLLTQIDKAIISTGQRQNLKFASGRVLQFSCLSFFLFYGERGVFAEACITADTPRPCFVWCGHDFDIS